MLAALLTKVCAMNVKTRSLAGRAMLKASRATTATLTRARPRPDMVRLGSGYGGWWVPTGLLGPDSVCYSAGVGEDVTFDLALIKKFGCEVWAFDPTPRSIIYAETVDDPSFHFVPVGLWSVEADLRFYAPVDPSHVSHSAVNAQHTTDYFVAKCKPIATLMHDIGHDRLDLLKMDIEGAEVPVLDAMLNDGPMPRVLCVEFDAPEAPWTTLRRIRRLCGAGYVPRYVEGRNYTFTRT